MTGDRDPIQQYLDELRLSPLAAVVASIAVGVGLLVLYATTHITFGPWSAVIIYAAVGLTVTYGLRMWRMLWNQARGRGELA